MKIIKANINTAVEPRPVTVTIEDGSSHKLFSYFSDELHFSSEEFVGLTIDQALELHRKRDIAYLQS